MLAAIGFYIIREDRVKKKTIRKEVCKQSNDFPLWLPIFDCFPRFSSVATVATCALCQRLSGPRF